MGLIHGLNLEHVGGLLGVQAALALKGLDGLDRGLKVHGRNFGLRHGVVARAASLELLGLESGELFVGLRRLLAGPGVLGAALAASQTLELAVNLGEGGRLAVELGGLGGLGGLRRGHDLYLSTSEDSFMSS